MDPNAVLQRIERAYLNLQYPSSLEELFDLSEACQTLWTWLSYGGFEPEWEKFPVGTEQYQKFVMFVSTLANF